MAARQQHGFDYQTKVIDEWGLTPEENYIGKHDAYSFEKDGTIYPAQIKTIKFGSSIDLGDYLRNKNRKQDFALFIGFHSGPPDNKIIEGEEYLLEINVEWWRGLFQAQEGFDEEIYQFLKGISNNREDDTLWKQTTAEFKKIWNESWKEYSLSFSDKWQEIYSKRLIIPRFKRDHKKQKRIQCAIPNKMFYKHFLRWV